MHFLSLNIQQSLRPKVRAHILTYSVFCPFRTSFPCRILVCCLSFFASILCIHPRLFSASPTVNV